MKASTAAAFNLKEADGIGAEGSGISWALDLRGAGVKAILEMRNRMGGASSSCAIPSSNHLSSG